MPKQPKRELFDKLTSLLQQRHGGKEAYTERARKLNKRGQISKIHQIDADWLTNFNVLNMTSLQLIIDALEARPHYGTPPPSGVVAGVRGCKESLPADAEYPNGHRCNKPAGHEGPHQCMFCGHEWIEEEQKPILKLNSLKRFKTTELDPRSLLN